MGYQALLFCPDEKLARVVGQVFSELDFSVEPVHEPFAAVKRLMAQRYDAIVVDCENEQSASLLFKSARNSSFNQSSLAIALVEGQAGVAKAYRIGANLVLTKPINVDQAKGTLRVARGLLRKSCEPTGVSGAASATPARSAPVSEPASPPTSGPATAVTDPPSVPEIRKIHTPSPKVSESLPAMAPVVNTEKPTRAPAPSLSASSPTVAQPVAETRPSPVSDTARNEPVKSDTTKADAIKKGVEEADSVNEAVSASAPRTASAFGLAAGSAAAPAPAKAPPTAAIEEKKTVESEPVRESQAGPPASASSLGLSNVDSPSFAELGAKDSSEAGGRKTLLIAALIVVALAVLGYFGYMEFAKSAPSTPAPGLAAPQASGQPAPAPAPISSPQPAAEAKTTNRSSSAPTPGPKTASPALPGTPAAGAVTAPTVRNAPAANANPEPETKNPTAEPIIVRSAGSKPQTQSDESAPPPSPIADASTSGSLTGLIASAGASPARPSLATLKISQGVSQGLLIKRVQPKYPPAALAVHAQGLVLIEAIINKEGVVTNPKVISGDPVLARAALDAVRQWRYKPYYLDREPVEIQTQITINFKAN